MSPLASTRVCYKHARLRRLAGETPETITDTTTTMQPESPDTTEGRLRYQQAYHKDYQKRTKRVSPVLTLAEYAQLKREAKRHAMPVATFARACIFAYLDGTYVVPDEERLHQLEVALRRIGSNVNQIAARAHRVGLSTFEISNALALVYELEDQVAEALRRPGEVET